ncbi:hypothetical protein EON65_23050 [archaeon]|nr:MAG: hypothetical protein EON65_23050 [archaeon]
MLVLIFFHYSSSDTFYLSFAQLLQVNYKETISNKAEFNYLHKKQSGGAGQYAKVIGHILPVDTAEALQKGIDYEFENQVVGTNIPPEFIPSCEKGSKLAIDKGNPASPIPISILLRFLLSNYFAQLSRTSISFTRIYIC